MGIFSKKPPPRDLTLVIKPNPESSSEEVEKIKKEAQDFIKWWLSVVQGTIYYLDEKSMKEAFITLAWKAWQTRAGIDPVSFYFKEDGT